MNRILLDHENHQLIHQLMNLPPVAPEQPDMPPQLPPRPLQRPSDDEASNQQTQGHVSTAFKCQTVEASTLCIYDAGLKLNTSSDYDIGGTYSGLESEFWFFFTTTPCPGHNYLLNIFVCHRKSGNFSIDISDSNKVTYRIESEEVQHVNLPATFASVTLKTHTSGQIHFIKSFCFTHVERFTAGCTLFIPIKINLNPKISIDPNVLKSIKLQHDMSELLTKQETADLVLISASKKQFPTHKILLAAHSAVIRNMMRNNPSSLFIDIDDQDMELLLEFIYTGTIKDILQHDCLKVLEIAAKFELQPLCMLSQHVIIDQINVDNAVDMAVLAKKYNLLELQDKVFAYILKNPKVMTTDAWKNLDDVELTKLMLQYTYESRA